MNVPTSGRDAARSDAQPVTAIRLTRRYAAPPGRLFAAWLDESTAARWLFATATQPMATATIDARVSGRFRFVEQRARVAVHHTGQYLEIDRDRRLVFTLHSDAQREPTRVVVEIAPSGRGSALTVTHENVPAPRAADLRARWHGMLYGLGELCAAPPA